MAKRRTSMRGARSKNVALDSPEPKEEPSEVQDTSVTAVDITGVVTEMHAERLSSFYTGGLVRQQQVLSALSAAMVSGMGRVGRARSADRAVSSRVRDAALRAAAVNELRAQLSNHWNGSLEVDIRDGGAPDRANPDQSLVFSHLRWDLRANFLHPRTNITEIAKALVAGAVLGGPALGVISEHTANSAMIIEAVDILVLNEAYIAVLATDEQPRRRYSALFDLGGYLVFNYEPVDARRTAGRRMNWAAELAERVSQRWP